MQQVTDQKEKLCIDHNTQFSLKNAEKIHLMADEFCFALIGGFIKIHKFSGFSNRRKVYATVGLFATIENMAHLVYWFTLDFHTC